ncbi:flavin reductase family protein [Streptomyces sp. PTD5-9]|uniref:flavin reductase family protein n=1 Tax=Streptomyces sp. PTD5-9 TaxID=3120150 RepID=UPI00300B73BF
MSPAPGPGGPTAAEYLAAARTFPTGVTVVATRYRDGTPAKTVSAFASLSLDPLLVAVAIGRHSPLVWAARASGVLSVNVLRHDQREVADYYATPERLRAQPPPAGLSRQDTGAPVLDDCLSWFDCRLVTVTPGGDHALLIAQVVGVRTGGGPPLVHHGGCYRGLGRLTHRRADPAEAVRPTGFPPPPQSRAPAPGPRQTPAHRPNSVPRPPGSAPQHQNSVSRQQGTSP